jgi:hypothetical protein
MSNPLQSRRERSFLSRFLFWRGRDEVAPIIDQPDVNPERTREFYNSGRDLAIQSLARGKNADRYIQRARDMHSQAVEEMDDTDRFIHDWMIRPRMETQLNLANRELTAERLYANEAAIKDFQRRGSMTSERDMDPYMINNEIRGFLYGERPVRRRNAPPPP